MARLGLAGKRAVEPTVLELTSRFDGGMAEKMFETRTVFETDSKGFKLLWTD